MPDKSTDKELSIDELKEVSGSNRLQGGGYKAEGKQKASLSKSKSETMIGVYGDDEMTFDEEACCGIMRSKIG